MGFWRALTDLTEADISALVQDRAEESLTLEFKRELDLDRTDQKREAAKDVSAFANADGGRIVYGIDESQQGKGSVVAAAVQPLQDYSIVDRLRDVLLGSIHPRPRFALQRVDLAGGGCVLIAEVYSSDGDELHMVSGYSESRYYRRVQGANILMTEPEVREAYRRIAATRSQLEAEQEAIAAPEIHDPRRASESIVIAPWHSRGNLLDPRRLGDLRDRLMDLFSGAHAMRETLSQLHLEADAYRVTVNVYLALRRSGVVHMSDADAFRPGGESFAYQSRLALRRIVATMMIARFVYDAVAYAGRVRLRYLLTPPGPWYIARSVMARISVPPVPPDPPLDLGVDFDFSEIGDRFGPIAKEILDPVFQAEGEATCPYFSPEGAYKDPPDPRGLSEFYVKFLR